MADDTQKDLENIAKTTSDFAKELAKVRKEIKNSAKETNVWLDATKALQSAQSGMNSALLLRRNINDQLRKNREEIDRLENKEKLRLITNLSILSDQNEAVKLRANTERATANNTMLGAVEREGARNRLIALQDKSVQLEKEMQKTTQDIYDIDDKIIPALKDSTKELQKQLVVSRQIYKTERERKELAEMMQSLIKPLLGDSKEFNKSMEFGAKVMKGGSALYLAALDASLERWIELQKASGEFLKNTGLLVTQIKEFDSAARSINTEMQYLGVSLKDAYATAESLYKSFGTTALITRDMMFSSAKLAANLGLANEDVANFKSTFDSISKSTGSTSDDMIKASVALANMGGVAPSLVLKDMANASGTTLSFLSKSPIQLAKAVVEARRLGTTIEKIASSARGLLNYQESMTAELTASALIGRSISFQNARQLAYEGKIFESRKAALEQIKLAGDFTQLNVWQQDALAKAAQMTVEEIIKQQNQEKMLAALKNSTNANDRKAYYDYEKMTKSIAENEKNAKNDLVSRGLDFANQQLRQTELNKLTNSFSQIWTSITDALLPIANIIMPIIVGAVKALTIAFEFLAPPIGVIVSAFTIIAGFKAAFVGITAILGAWPAILAAITTGAVGLGITFGAAFWPLTAAAIAIYGLYELIKYLSPDIEDSLNEPYKNHLKYFENSDLAGNSPSKVGLSILDGIKSVGPKIEESLKTPFENARNSIEKIPSVESFVGNQDSTRTIQSKIQETITASVEIVNMDQLPVAINELNVAIDRLSKATSVGSIVNVLTENNSSAGVEEKLDKLTSLLINGSVRTYLNGRNVSSAMAKSS